MGVHVSHGNALERLFGSRARDVRKHQRELACKCDSRNMGSGADGVRLRSEEFR